MHPNGRWADISQRRTWPKLIYPSAVEFNLNKQISMLLHLEAVMCFDMGTTEV